VTLQSAEAFMQTWRYNAEWKRQQQYSKKIPQHPDVSKMPKSQA